MNIKTLLSTLLLMLLSIGVYSQNEKEPYVVLKDGIATFYYKDSQPDGALPLPSNKVYSPWEKDVKYSVSKVVFDDSFKDYEPTSCEFWFYDFQNLTEIIGMSDNLNTSNVIEMTYMFAYCSSLTSLDLSGFNPENVKSMAWMFYGCCRLHTIYVDKDKWILYKYLDAPDMFEGCDALFGENGTEYSPDKTTMKYAQIDGGVSSPGYLTAKGHTSYVSTISYPVPYAVLKDGVVTFRYDKNKPEDAFVFPKEGMFVWNKKDEITKIIFDKSFADFKPTSLRHLFKLCEKLTSIEDLQYLNTSEVTDMSGLFWSCKGLTTIDVSKLNTENVTNMEEMFCGCINLKVLDLSSLNTAKVKNLHCMFLWCENLTQLNLSNFNTSSVTNMSGMFEDCSSLKNLDISSFNTDKVTNMEMMFDGCINLVNLDLSSFNTSNVTNMSQLFCHCESLITIDLSNFNTSNVSTMGNMFLGCKNLSSIDLSKFNTSQVKSMYGMFSSCNSLQSIDLSNINTANVTDMSFMFADCDKLSSIIVGEGWTTSSVTASEKMFNLSPRIYGSKGSSPKSLQVLDATYAKIDGGASDPGYFTAPNESAFSKIESITIITLPKTDYKAGEDFSATNGLFELTYNTGEKDTIDLTNATITGFDKTKIGEQTLKVEYQGCETTFTTPVSSTPSTQTGIKVWSFNSAIYIESAPDTKYTIIDLNGRILKSATTKSTKEEIKINQHGIVIVTINGESFKVSL